MSPEHEIEIYWPRTKADFQQITEFIAQGFTNNQILEKLKNSHWRTQVVEFNEQLFCESCASRIAEEWCEDCGESTCWKKDLNKKRSAKTA